MFDFDRLVAEARGLFLRRAQGGRGLLGKFI